MGKGGTDVSRDKIKIIEFGMDDDRPSLPNATGGGAMKIVELDKDPGDSRKRVATARDIGHIKIVEFDNDPETEKTPVPEETKKRIGPLKIKEFDKEPETRESIGDAPKIKIMEFD